VRAFALLALCLIAADASAQVTKAPATKSQTPPATKAPATKQDAKVAAPATATKQQVTTKTAAPTTAPATKQDTKTTPAPATKQATKTAAPPPGTPAQRRPALAVAPEAAPAPRVPVIMREEFDYDAAGRRDPFVSLLTTTELRPTVADLRLVIVLFDPTGRRPVAVMRDLTTNTQYRVTTGMTLGRMRVSEIKRRSVIFSIEEFGLNRQDSLVLGDTTKARAR